MPLPRLISFPDLPWRKRSPWSLAGSQGLVLETKFLVDCFPVCFWSSVLLITWPLNKCNLFVRGTFIHVDPDVPFKTIFLLLMDWCSQNPFPRTCPPGWATEQCRIWVSRKGEVSSRAERSSCQKSSPVWTGNILNRLPLLIAAALSCYKLRTKQIFSCELCFEVETRARSKLEASSCPRELTLCQTCCACPLWVQHERWLSCTSAFNVRPFDVSVREPSECMELWHNTRHNCGTIPGKSLSLLL